jgi:hypothetical protein
MEGKWIAVLAIAAIVSLALGPVYWLRPTPRQRQLARLRAHAVKQGLRPEFRQLPAALAGRGYPERMMSYVWFRPEGWPREGERWLACVVDEGPQPLLQWVPDERREPPPAMPAVVPVRGLAALQADAEGVAAFWHEAGEVERVDQLRKAMSAWVEAYRTAHGADGAARTGGLGSAVDPDAAL